MKNLATFTAVALILASSAPFAMAASRHRSERVAPQTERTVVRQQPRNADSFAYWPSAPAQSYGYDSRYSGGWSAPAGQ